MNIEEAINNCEDCLEQIKQYEPEPYYVNYFFEQFINYVNKTFDGIFEEANRDFGLFISEKISEKSFEVKAKQKNDEKAIEFLEWYVKKFKQEHESPFPNFINKIILFKKKFDKLPEIKIMIRASERFKDDVFQQIVVGLSKQKLRSKDDLEIEIKRQLPVFLEIINHKRNLKNEPKVKSDQVVASAFLDIEDHNDIEILYASEIYIPVLKRIVDQSRKKIKELTIWK